MATDILKVLGVLFLAPSLFFFLYYFILALLSVVCRGKPAAPRRANENPRFAILVPAHNEEMSITPTLQSCRAIDYPLDKYDVFVIADNCTDDTAGIVRAHGFQCLERHDERLIGKGHALRWGFDQLLHVSYDAFVVLDADCQIDPHCLNVFANEIMSGQSVLQANSVVSNPDSSAISYAVAVGNAMENHLYYRPKSLLGLVVLLRGTGMVFRRDVLELHPWSAFSIAEDTDYSISLYTNGVTIKFLPGVTLRSPFPVRMEQLAAQRRRWAGGNMQLGKSRALKFLWEGISKGKVLYLDMGLTLMSQSKPLQLAFVGLLYLVSALGFLLTHERFFVALIGLSNALVLGYALYLLWGILSLGLSRRRFALLIQTPLVLAALVMLALRSIFVSRDVRWESTPRQ